MRIRFPWLLKLVLLGVVLAGARWVIKWKIYVVPQINSIAFSSDGQFIAGAGGWVEAHEGDSVQGAVWIWDGQTGALRQRLISSKERLRLVALTPDDTQVAAWQQNFEGFRWNLLDDKLLNAREAMLSRGSRVPIETGYLVDRSELPCSLLPSGCVLGDSKLMLHRKRLERAMAMAEKLAEAKFAMAMSQSGELVAFKRAEIYVREVKTGAKRGQFPFSVDRVHLMRFSPDGQWLLIGIWRESNAVSSLLWNHRTKSVVELKNSQRLIPTSAAFSPDGKRVAVGGLYGEVQLWDTQTGKSLARWQGS